ncbi:hypothetical protein G3N95_20485 [Paraburkholderia sp. Tr-20389]|uniref:hypothetical protein n=1 Tax=Paraburkholderia sp. Tr-20389 TaxID=2703903 RepID=UPI0019803D00|nr:hypothetical protein [Paraburkholderia sp. Tr-20389]MBN3755334.1 hypothetical protein [Paraburkholderia sp. Tr-20389]
MTGGTGVEPENLLDTLVGYQRRIIKGRANRCFMKLYDQPDSRCRTDKKRSEPKMPETGLDWPQNVWDLRHSWPSGHRYRHLQPWAQQCVYNSRQRTTGGLPADIVGT